MKNYLLIICIVLLSSYEMVSQQLNELSDWAIKQEHEITVTDAVDFLNGSRANGDISVGLEYVFNSGNSIYVSATTMDDTHFVVVYRDSDNSNYGTAIVGTVTGNTISYGPEYVFNNASSTYSSVTALDATHFIIAYMDGNNSNYGTTIMGTVSGSALSFGAEFVFNTALSSYCSVTSLDESNFVVAYRDDGNSRYGTAIVGTVSGSTISFGSENVFNSTTTSTFSVSSLSASNFVIAYSYTNGIAIVGSVSGNTITYGSNYVFNTSTSSYCSVSTLDESSFFVAYQDYANSKYGTAIVGNITGSIVTYGSEYVFNSGTTDYCSVITLDANHFVIGYRDVGNSNYGTAISGTISGNEIIYGNEAEFNLGDTRYISLTSLNETKFVATYQNYANSRYGTAIVGETNFDVIWDGSSGTDWNTPANWSNNLVPTAIRNIIIPNTANQLIIENDPNLPAICNNLTIEVGAFVTVSSGKALTVEGDLAILSFDPTALTVDSDATGTGSLIVKGSILGDVQMERYIAAWSDATHGWHFLSSPVASQVINEFHTAGSGNDFYSWDESSDLWINRTATGGGLNGSFETNFTEGKGYLVANGTSDTKIFFGHLNNSDVTKSSLTYTTPSVHTGWNLLGNPFSSALYWNKTAWNLNNIDGTAKIWEESSASYTDIPSTTGIIPATQGFMVHVTGSGTGSLTIDATDRVHNSTNWYKDTELNKIVLTVYDIEGETAQQSVIKFNQNATSGFDSQFDSWFLEGYAPQLFSVISEGVLSTNTLPEITSETSIPMSFIKNSSSTYYIEATGINNLTSQETVYFTDLKTNHTQILNDNPIYNFTSEEGDIAERFVLHFGPLSINDNQLSEQINIFSHNNIVEIRNSKPTEGTINIYTISGQLISTSKLKNESNIAVVLPNYKGVAIVSVTTSRQTVTEKVIIW